MQVKLTSRRFRARPEIKDHAAAHVRKLGRFYDGIVNAAVILSFEGAEKNIKVAEINLQVHGTVLTVKEKSDDFRKSIDLAIEKATIRIERYKSKLRAKDKMKVRELKYKA
jgi:ribosomal subunit interface protein